MKIIEIYRHILKYVGMEADDEGYISTILQDRRDPAFINGARMVLPMPNHLKNFNPKEKIIFHPLTESIFRGESEVFVKMKTVINIKLNYTTGILAQALLDLVASPEQHKKFNADQTDLLVAIKDSDEKSVTNLTSIMMQGIKNRPDRLFTSIYIKKGGMYKERKYGRVGIVSFPFFAELLDDKVEKIRVKDKDTYKQLFRFMFPNIDEAESYNFGSNSHVAPNIEALMMTSANIATRLNDLIDMFKEFIDEPDMLRFDSEWVEYFDNLEALGPEIKKIPVQHGNEGATGSQEEPQMPTPQVQMHQPMQIQPQMYPNQPMQMQQPMMAPMQRPEIKVTNKGIDFKSMIQANPQMQMMQNPLAGQINAQQMEMQRQMMMQQQQQQLLAQQQMLAQQMAGQMQQPMMQQPMMYPNQGMQMQQPQMYPNQQMVQQPMYPNVFQR